MTAMTGSGRTALAIAATGVALILAATMLDGGPARYVHIRWKPDVTAEQRLARIIHE